MLNGTNGTAARNPRYSVAEAAELLGVTTRAVRKRIAAGRLPAERTPHGWAIALEPEPPTELAAPATEPPAPAELGELQEPAAPTELATVLAEPTAEPAAPPAELTALRAQVAWFQAEIERRDTAEAELRRLLALALQRPALPAPSEPESADGADLPPRPWWAALRWWHR